MDTTDAVKLFRNNWFRRNEEHLELTPAEEQLITAALGRAPKRWSGAPDVERMEKILADEPSVLDRIGAQLLQVVIGMKGAARPYSSSSTGACRSKSRRSSTTSCTRRRGAV